jgi:H+-translocating NAD(P) transhydrogenase subunit alpha
MMKGHFGRVLSTKYSVLGTQHSSLQRLAQQLAGILLVALFAAPALADPAAPAGSAARPPIVAASTADWPAMLFVFMLATFIGLGVITRVSRLLHTPLMSLTNAISAIAVVAAIAMAGSDHPLPITILGAIALFASTTNIVSGFLITDRMLKMFKRQEPK